jgi:hypothetical protein
MEAEGTHGQTSEEEEELKTRTVCVHAHAHAHAHTRTRAEAEASGAARWSFITAKVQTGARPQGKAKGESESDSGSVGGLVVRNDRAETDTRAEWMQGWRRTGRDSVTEWQWRVSWAHGRRPRVAANKAESDTGGGMRANGRATEACR